MNDRTLNEYFTRIRAATFRIGNSVPTQVRTVLDAYLRHASASLKNAGETMLPCALRRHPANDDRTQTYDRPGVLFFHVGNAIVSGYECAKLPYSDKPPTEQEATLIALLERRVRLLEHIADHGYRAFIVQGDGSKGYYFDGPPDLKPAPVQAVPPPPRAKPGK